MEARHYLISGRVQGVWYRASCAEQAQRLGLQGWVRNLADGRVEAVAAGPSEQLEALARWMADGPPLASVSAVAVAPWTGSVPSGRFAAIADAALPE